MVDRNAKAVFHEIYDSTNRKVLVYITAKCSNTADIIDIFQETYIELYSVITKRGENYIENKEAFVMKLARQKVYRYYSLLDRLKAVLPLTYPIRDGEEFDIYGLDIQSFSVEDNIVNEALIEQVNTFLSSKPEVIKKIFYLFYQMELTIPEIATHLSMSESNVKNRLYRTLKELRQLYQ
ncbi:RNA polymerase sigma factor [Tumebacillus lipolyticus]|uniref:RNA polymerase sigma factor n=1 Tax=Tumebacillus lipolyticus TaxID=1280370 RepID=A0ABW4ZZL1_9BACL